MVKMVQKLVEYIRRYSTKYEIFLVMTYLKFTNDPCQLWSYWTEFYDIFTQYAGIICTVNAHIEVAISRSISECQSNESGEFAISVQEIRRYLFRYLLSNHDKITLTRNASSIC